MKKENFRQHPERVLIWFANATLNLGFVSTAILIFLSLFHETSELIFVGFALLWGILILISSFFIWGVLTVFVKIYETLKNINVKLDQMTP